MKPKISVLMSVFNETETELKKAVESILNQTYPNFEFIIVLDNPQKKELKKCLLHYQRMDKRINLILNQKNSGLIASLNLALFQASGDYIARMDADDISIEQRLEKELNHLIQNQSDMVFSQRLEINEQGQLMEGNLSMPKKKEKLERLLPVQCFVTHPSVLMKKSILNMEAGYRDLPSAEDYDLWLRFLTGKYKIDWIDEPLICYRIRRESISKSDKYKQYLTERYVKFLYKERSRSLYAQDSYSKEHYESYLKKNGYYDPIRKKSFNTAFSIYHSGSQLIKESQYWKGSKKIAESLKSNYRMMYFIFNHIQFKFMNH